MSAFVHENKFTAFAAAAAGEDLLHIARVYLPFCFAFQFACCYLFMKRFFRCRFASSQDLILFMASLNRLNWISGTSHKCCEMMQNSCNLVIFYVGFPDKVLKDSNEVEIFKFAQFSFKMNFK